ncbi:hypothetical protein [Parasphingorhabdus pacifica]
MTRSLLTPKWLLLHALFLAAVITTGLLAWWQWGRANDAGGSFQNLGYALQWPLFGAFTLFLWQRVVRMGMEERAEGDEPRPEEEAAPEGPGRHSVRTRPLVPPPAEPVTDDEDPELAAYNKYLAELNEAEQGR